MPHYRVQGLRDGQTIWGPVTMFADDPRDAIRVSLMCRKCDRDRAKAEGAEEPLRIENWRVDRTSGDCHRRGL